MLGHYPVASISTHSPFTMHCESKYDVFLDEDVSGRSITQKSTMTRLDGIPTYSRRIMLTGGAGFM